ncbi:MAG: hypothetical protein ACRDSZ_21485 [Pseudonocardiaceae bacterium]
MPTPPIAAPAPLSDLDHTDARRTATYDSVAPPVLGLVGDRPIEPVVTDYAATPAAEQTRWPAVQRRSTVEGQGRAAHVSGPTMLATTAVQRSASAGANRAARWPPKQWPPGALAVSRSSPGVSQQEPTQPVQLVQFAPAPVVAESNPPELSTTLVVQRADDEPAAATSPPTTTGAAAGTTPAPPVDSTSTTEVDTLVRRLYDPIVRRLKAELQLDRERAGYSLDHRH